MKRAEVKIHESWKNLLKEQFELPYFLQMVEDLKAFKREGTVIFPPGPLIFNAFNSTPVDQVKVVILGQDPYHNPGQAMGLSFSVPKDVRIPPSLLNIYKEMKEDIGLSKPHHGDLTPWSQQGVLLLNAMLTVEKNKPGSHRKLGWQTFTDAAILKLSEQRKNLVFLLWGNFARSKKAFIHPYNEHLILEAPHPSPMARGGFFGCKHFSKANEFLIKTGQQPVDWKL